jgi:hypothetical protein
MLTPEQVERARNWMYGTQGSHLHDGYERLRRWMMIGGVDLPFRIPAHDQFNEAEQELWVLYFDILQEFADAAYKEELRRRLAMPYEELAALVAAEEAERAAWQAKRDAETPEQREAKRAAREARAARRAAREAREAAELEAFWAERDARRAA